MVVEEEVMAFENQVTKKILKDLDIEIMEYANSLNHYSLDKQFVKELDWIETKAVKKLLADEPTPDIPEDLTIEVAKQIQMYAQKKICKILSELEETHKDPIVLKNESFFGMKKVDDLVFVKYGYQSKVVMAAFQEYCLVQKHLEVSGLKAAPYYNLSERDKYKILKF